MIFPNSEVYFNCNFIIQKLIFYFNSRMSALQFQWKTIQSNPFSQKPSSRWGHSCCVVNQSLYMFGGFANCNYMNDLWKYSLAQLKWKQVFTEGDIPEKRSNATLNYDSVNHQLLLFGGGGSNKQRFNSISILDLSNMNWVQIFPFQNQSAPWQRTYHAAQFKSPYLIVFGGEGADDIDDLWVYNINTLAWNQIKIQPSVIRPCARRFHSSCLIDNKFYIYGGCNGKYNCLGDMFYLDMTQLLENGKCQNLKWEEIVLNGKIAARWGHTSHYYNGEIYVFGGRSSQDLKDISAINPKTGQVRNLLTIKQPQARRRHSGGLMGSSLIIFGGFDGNYFNDLFYLNLFIPKNKQNYKKNSLSNSEIKQYTKDITIKTIEGKQISASSLHFGRYFNSKYNLSHFLELINQNYCQETIKQMVNIFQVGYGELSISPLHKCLLDNHPSQQPLTRSDIVYELIGQKMYYNKCFQSEYVALESLNFKKYLSYLEEHWQNDSAIMLNGKVIFMISKARLLAHSQFFSNLMSKHYSQIGTLQVSLPNCDPLHFQIIIAYLVTSILVVPAHSSNQLFTSLLELAEYFSLPSLVTICENELCQRVNEDNYEQLMNLSEIFKLQTLGQTCSYKQLGQLIKISRGRRMSQIQERKLTKKTQSLYKQIQFDLLHSNMKLEESNKIPILNAQNGKQNQPYNSMLRKSSTNY